MSETFTMDIPGDLSLVIVSCDRYSDVWPAFFSSFWRFWSDCPYPIYLGTNDLVHTDPRVHTVRTGNDSSWGENTRKLVEQVGSPYLLLMLEDFFVRRRVVTEEVERCFLALKKLEGGYLRLKPFPKPDHGVPGFPEIGEIKHGAPYRSALQAAIWRKDVLLSMLLDGESAWDMELLGSRRSDSLTTAFYATWKPVLVYEAGVTKGKWLPWAYRLCRELNVPVDLSTRPVMSSREHLRWLLSGRVNALVNRVPWERRRPAGDLLRRLRFLPPRADIKAPM